MQVTSHRPLQLDSFVRKQAGAVWANIERSGRAGVQKNFLDWLNRQLKKKGLDTIQLQRCVSCAEDYWVLGDPMLEFQCEVCEEMDSRVVDEA